MKTLTLKTKTILTLILCQRAQTLFTLDLKHMKLDKDVYTLTFNRC